MDTVRELGGLALGTRFRRISERLFEEVEQIYITRELNLSPRLFAALFHLSRRDEISIGSLACGLGFTHPAAIQVVKELERSHLVRTHADPKDGRCTLISLSKAGLSLIDKAKPIWAAIRVELDERVAAAGANFLSNLDSFEDALLKDSLADAVLNRLSTVDAGGKRGSGVIEILGWRDDLKDFFRELNTEWLSEYDFAVEPKDVEYFADPRGAIMSKGGAIFFARLDSQIVGTCALLPRDDGLFELAKMGVTRSARGFGIGKRLSLTAIEHARARGERALLLETNSKLKAAIKLYKSLGFKKIPQKAQYQRVNIVMKLDL